MSKDTPALKTKRLLIECSYIIATDHMTGIQRVVRNILNESQKLKLGPDYGIHYVVWSNGKFHEIKWPITASTPQKLPAYRRLAQSTARWGRLILPSAFFSLIRRFYIWAKPMAKKVVITNAVKDNLGQPLELGPNDTLVLLDSSWQMPYWREVYEAKQRGAKIGVVVYDLIPIRHPQFCDSGVVVAFSGWLTKAIQLADFCLAISKATAADVKAYIKSNNPSLSLKVNSFDLGAQIDKKTKRPTREFAEKILNETGIYISVGTIEPRKNQEFLLDVFEKLWSSGVDIKLCLIGKIGWHTESLVKRVLSHPEYQKRLFMLNDLNDNELELAYQKAKALLIPSIQEGYGLPIIEALNHKRPVFASDIPVFREVGGPYCAYFSLSSTKDLVSKLYKFEKTNKFPARIPSKNMQWPTWHRSTVDFINKAIKLSE